mgnify:CR=1 FL=1
MKKSYSSVLSVLFILAFLGFIFFTMMPQWTSDDDAPLAEFSTQRALEQVKNISQKPHFVGSENHDVVVNYLVKELQKIEGAIRTLSHDISSENNFNNSDFNNILYNLIEANNKISNTHFTIDIGNSINWGSYSSLIKINVYRILQELFLNVNKYANATTCALNIEKVESMLHISIADDGVGFSTTKTSEGIGLKNIKERLELINGTLSILSAPNKGAKFYLTIPIE